MTTGASQIAAETMRRKVPTEWLTEFETGQWSNEELADLADDLRVGKLVRAYAAWELDYRTAFGLDYRWQGVNFVRGKVT